MLSTYEQKSKLKLAATVVTILVIAGVVVLADHIKSSKSNSATLAQNTSSTTTPSSSTPTTSTDDTSSSDNTSSSSSTSTTTTNYKDGTYTATSDYEVPHGDEEIQVKLTLSSGTITDVSIENSEYDHDSARYQEDFAAEYKSYVVGKKISGLQLSYIAGASDTTEGFNDALSKIASQAQA